MPQMIIGQLNLTEVIFSMLITLPVEQKSKNTAKKVSQPLRQKKIKMMETSFTKQVKQQATMPNTRILILMAKSQTTSDSKIAGLVMAQFLHSVFS